MHMMLLSPQELYRQAAGRFKSAGGMHYFERLESTKTQSEADDNVCVIRC